MATVALHAEVVVGSNLLLRCIVDGRSIDLHPLHLQPGTTAWRSGDQGVIVIPDWLAKAMRLAPTRLTA